MPWPLPAQSLAHVSEKVTNEGVTHFFTLAPGERVERSGEPLDHRRHVNQLSQLKELQIM